ncbi:MAG: hypothetical protein AAF543_04730 [Pseudomonadota bacterium]
MSIQSSTKKPILKAALAIAAILVLLEAGAYVFMIVLGKNFYLPLALTDLTEDTIPERMQSEFSPELGWEPDHPNAHGYRGEAKPVEDAAIAVFGDKYTVGHADIDKSWTAQLEDKLGRPVLNFGVGAYGPDQALLRFEHRYVDKLETPYVALVMMSGAGARIVNRYRGFYARGTDIRYPKPMFAKVEGGEIGLLSNPVESVEGLVKLSDSAFLEEIGEQDYWYRYFEHYGLNEHPNFSYAYHLAKAVPYYVKRWHGHSWTNRQSYQAVYQDDDAVDVLRFIVQRFIGQAEAEGAVPVFVVLPNRADMEAYVEHGRTSYESAFDQLETIDHPHLVDGLDFFKAELEGGTGVDAFFQARGDDSLTARAEQIIGEAMHRLIIDIDAGEGLLEGPAKTADVSG